MLYCHGVFGRGPEIELAGSIHAILLVNWNNPMIDGTTEKGKDEKP